jgi:hypothetical protein
VDGQFGFVGVEMKLSELFSDRECDRHEYWRWLGLPDSAWRSECRDALPNRRHNQLWRDHPLAAALLWHRHTP